MDGLRGHSEIRASANNSIAFFVSKKIQAENRTSSVPSSILLYVVDKGQYFDLEFCLYPVLFPKVLIW